MPEIKIQEISSAITSNAWDKGFWNSPEPDRNAVDIPQKLMLIVTELAEAMEADRKGLFCDDSELTAKEMNTATDNALFKTVFERNIKDTFEDELADVAIRLFDLAYKMDIDLESHILAKHRYNCMREFKHGKKY